MITEYVRVTYGESLIVERMNFDASHGADRRFGVSRIRALELVNTWNRQAVEYAETKGLARPVHLFWVEQ